ncbi:GroES-like protein [Exidia glandulosa HHB12029]|uniref:GroES-like protein n=1 Tax=Exidia glandulosa HHB12029 TaxID=1314781 RepID=A0A165MKS4_EXIGL|nr:GroES-like protein [Exidia glandulosa HHB12029]
MELLIENIAIAQNPVDWKQLAWDYWIPDIPWTNGCDVTGTVVKVGSGVTKFKAGDRIVTYLSRRTPRHGSYQTLSIADESLTAHLPERYTYEQGATIPLGFITAACGLINPLGVKLLVDGPSKNESLLVWGGSSSCGAFAIQLAKAAGYTVFSTASPVNHDYVLSLGASAVFDYHDDDVVEKIRNAAGPNLSLVYDAIAENGSIEASAACITSPSGGVIASVLGIPEKDFGNVKVLQARAFLIGESKEVNDITYEILDAMLQSGKLIPNRVKVLPGGLRAVKEGWELGREHKISGEKFVYRIAETQF